MKSFTVLSSLFQTYAQNTASDLLTWFQQSLNDTHRYLLQKFFDNEASYSITTIGANTVTMTAVPAIGATSATLTYAWPFASSNVQVPFSDGELRTVVFTNGSTAITWQGGLAGTKFYTTAVISAGDTSATLQSPWAYTTGSYVIQFSDGEQKTVTLTNGSTAVSWAGGLLSNVSAYFNTSIITVNIGVGGVQEYNLPPDYSKLKTETLTIGNLKWTPTEILTRQEWDKLNVFPYYSDIPSHFFIYNRKLNIWPIPATTGNVIGFNYKRRVPDLSMADYTTPGTATVSNGGIVVTGSTSPSTTWIPTMNNVSESRWIQFSQPTGDNLWYQVQNVASPTLLTLTQPYQGNTITASTTYTIGQMPLLNEDFHDLLAYRPLMLYFSSIQADANKAAQFKAMYQEGEARLADYSGSKTINVNLSRTATTLNPNLFNQSFGQ